MPTKSPKMTGVAHAYDPFRVDHDAIEAAAEARDNRDVVEVDRFEYSKPERIEIGDPRFNAVWSQSKREWRRRADAIGVHYDREPKSVIVDVDDDGVPLTTHDETIHGDGRLADGTPIGSEVAVSRCLRNFAHVLGVMAESKRTGKSSAEVDANCNWNWTKGRPFRESDPTTDVVHAIGEKVDHPAPRWDRCRSVVMWPDPQMKAPAKRAPRKESPLR